MDELQKKEIGKIIVCDIFESSLEAAKKMFKNFDNIEYKLVEKGDNSILFEKVDIVAPCATGGTLNDDTIPSIQAPIVCGAANNQLKDENKHSRMLKENNIVYVPDFLTNRMGIVNCANEQYGSLDHDPAIERHLNYEWENSVFVLVKHIVTEAQTGEETTGNIALKMAKEKTKELHPIWGNRSRLIIRSLMEKGWAKN
jgi:glutamate dehydrogenase/leucine dehydrogenase